MRHCAFAEFYRFRADHEQWDSVCGDRSVVILDGRKSLSNQKADAADVCRKRGFNGYRVARGTFTNPFYLTAGVIRV